MTNQELQPSSKKKIISMQKDKEQQQLHLLRNMHSFEGKLADMVTQFSGSMLFAYLHGLWFFLWIVINHGLLHNIIPPFDPFPYGLLTMIVSLEAIFLSTFIMVSQNRQALLDTYRDIEEDKEQAEEEKEQEALERDVDEIQTDLDDIKAAMMTISQKLTNVEKIRSHKFGNGNGAPHDSPQPPQAPTEENQEK